jgi:hypothetical protein
MRLDKFLRCGSLALPGRCLAGIMGSMATGRDWQRLADAVRERRTELGLTQEDARAAGGPSTATLRLIEGALQDSYQPSTLRELEKALRWERGSVVRILAGGDPVPQRDLRAVPIRKEDLPAVLQDLDLDRLAPYIEEVDRHIADVRPWQDDYEARTWRNTDVTLDGRRTLIAMYRMLRDELASGSGRSRTGLAVLRATPSGHEAVSMR